MAGSFDEVSQDAYSKIVEALSKDMPLIFHGSGDVVPSEINRESTRIVAELTANYISNLVAAAVDSQEILNDGQRPPLPPPPLVSKEKRRKPPLPSKYVWPPSLLAHNGAKGKATSSKKKKSTTAAVGAAAIAAATTSIKEAAVKRISASNIKPGVVNNNKFGEKKKRKRRDVDYWDEPLPEPKIKNKPEQASMEEGIVYEGVPIEDWVGVAGVDFFEDSRIRKAHVALPTAIGAQCFIFPVCHDKHLYGKILEIQATRRSMEPLLQDSVVMNVIRNEGLLQGSGALRKRTRFSNPLKKDGGDTQEDDDEEPETTDYLDDEDSGRPVWPGLDELLPMHTTMDF
jgi:hypothetical protein